MESTEINNGRIDENQCSLAHPLYLLKSEVSDKTLKKSSLEQISTIALCLGKQRTKNQLLPFLMELFSEQNTEYKAVILQSIKTLIDPNYLTKISMISVLSFTIDVLCVFSHKELRDLAYACIKCIFTIIDIQKAQTVLLNAITKLSESAHLKDADTVENIRQCLITIIGHIYSKVSKQNQHKLVNLIEAYKQNNIKTLVTFLTIAVQYGQTDQFVLEILKFLVESKDPDIHKQIIQPLISMTHQLGSSETKECLSIICLDTSQNSIFSTLIFNLNQLSALFPEHILQPIFSKLNNYQEQSQQIKNTILQMIDKIDFLVINPELCNKIVSSQGLYNSIQLKTTLVDTLCRIGKQKSNRFNIQFSYDNLRMFVLSEEISKDVNFLVKIFPKLPPIAKDLHEEILMKIMDNKSWRQKLVVLQNIENRTKIGENTKLLLNELFKNIGDKIANVRVAVAETIAKIMLKHQDILQARFAEMVNKITKSSHWFQRQSLYLVINIIMKSYNQEGTKIQSKQLEEIISHSQQETIPNIKFISKQLTLLYERNKQLQ